MVDIDLSGAHSAYLRDVPEILESLIDTYPGAELRSVRLYQPRPGDTSMATTLSGGHIRLNAYWFARDPSFLEAAAGYHPIITVDGVNIGWHGPMRWEPLQVLTHEFGHAVGFSLPQSRYRDWVGDRWRAATRNPGLAPSGYSLDSEDEFFGEDFALVHLGYATEEETADLMDLIGGLR